MRTEFLKEADCCGTCAARAGGDQRTLSAQIEERMAAALTGRAHSVISSPAIFCPSTTNR
ncbi:MAG: heterodisulfide reductase-related iron-sulfur binding cluster [Sphingobium sp.]